MSQALRRGAQLQVLLTTCDASCSETTTLTLKKTIPMPILILVPMTSASMRPWFPVLPSRRASRAGGRVTFFFPPGCRPSGGSSANHLGGNAEIFGHRFNRISAADLVARDGSRVSARVSHCLPGAIGMIRRLSGESVIVVKTVGLGNRLGRGVISARDRSQGFSGLHLVITPPDALIDRNGRDRGLELGGGSGGQMEFELRIFRRRQPQQAGIEFLQDRKRRHRRIRRPGADRWDS